MPYSHSMKDEKPPRKLLPIGWRRFKITQCKEGTSKAGNDKFVIDLLDKETNHIEELHLISVPGKRWMLKRLLEACKVKASEDHVYEWDISEIIDCEILGYIEHEPNEYINRAGETIKGVQAKVTDFQEAPKTDEEKLWDGDKKGVEEWDKNL